MQTKPDIVLWSFRRVKVNGQRADSASNAYLCTLWLSVTGYSKQTGS